MAHFMIILLFIDTAILGYNFFVVKVYIFSGIWICQTVKEP